LSNIFIQKESTTKDVICKLVGKMKLDVINVIVLKFNIHATVIICMFYILFTT